jgi:hypothetical protein
VPTGRNANDAVASVPAGEAGRVNESTKVIGAVAEDYVREVLLDPWEKVKRQLSVGRVDDEVQRLISEMDRHILHIPGTVAHDILTEIPMMTFGTYQPLETFNRLLNTARGGSGHVNPADALALRRELNGRKILDAVSERLAQ